MKKRTLSLMLALAACLVLAGCAGQPAAADGGAAVEPLPENFQMTINGQIVETSFEDNDELVDAFLELLTDGPVTLELSDLGGTRKVGNLSKAITKTQNMAQVEPNTILISGGNQLQIYYDAGAATGVRLGHVEGFEGLELFDLMGKRDCTVKLELVEQ